MATMPWQEIYNRVGFSDPNHPPSLEAMKTCIMQAEQTIVDGQAIFGSLSKHLLIDLIDEGKHAQHGQEKSLATKILAFFCWHVARWLQDTDEMNHQWDVFYDL